MNAAATIAILGIVPLVLVLAGYWLAARMPAIGPAERMAVATLAGLGALSWNVATFGFFKPLAGGSAWLCLWPIVGTLASRRSREALASDLNGLFRSQRVLLALACAAALLGYLLWPSLSRSWLVYHDGTANHDAFFWIVGAEHLMRHSYMEQPLTSATQPLMSTVSAIVGWEPLWGRMGGEGLLALAASLAHAEPIRIYLAATAALLVPWMAAVYLATRTFLVGRLSALAVVALAALQPVFVFSQGNSNLPNLLGALFTAGAVVSTERALRESGDRWAWLTLLCLSVHGILCSYPEMLPFAIMPAGLLWLRAWFRRAPRLAWRTAAIVALGWLAGLVLNPVSSVRAWWGFLVSFSAARENDTWANLFERLSPFQYPAALATLSVGSVRKIGVVAAILVTAALGFALVRAWRRANDRAGALLMVSGAGALLAYTVAADFAYGWQKTVQFGGALWASLLPVAAVDSLASCAVGSRLLRFTCWTALGLVILFFAHATVLQCLDSHKWADRKFITEDWFGLKEFAERELPGEDLLVDATSFRMAFFYGMWAPYFLREQPVYYAARGEQDGGYLRDFIAREDARAAGKPAAMLVARDWADAFDAGTPRLIEAREFVLLREANRVLGMSGVYPLNGVPDAAATRFSFILRPAASGRLLLNLDPFEDAEIGDMANAEWLIRIQTQVTRETLVGPSGPPPWQIEIPLERDKVQTIQVEFAGAAAPDSGYPFAIRRLRFEADRLAPATSGHPADPSEEPATDPIK